MYTCMYVCMHACMHACMHVCMHLRHTHAQVCLYVRMFVCMYVRMWHMANTSWSCSLVSKVAAPERANALTTEDAQRCKGSESLLKFLVALYCNISRNSCRPI